MNLVRPSIGKVAARCRFFLALALAFAACTAGDAADRSAELLLIRVSIEDRGRDILRLQALDLDVAGVDVKSQSIDVIGDRGVYDDIRAVGLSARIERDLTAERASNPITAYRDPAEVNAAIDALVAAHPAIAVKIAYAATEEGRPVYALKISDNAATHEDEPAIFIMAQHHAREIMTPEIALDVAEQLLNGYGTDPKLTAWVDGREIFVLPNHNPDGASWVFDRDKMWRKNRRDNGDNSFGVDLNRNYSFGWGTCGGSSGDTGSDGYRGPAPASEPETAGIIALASQYRPVISLSYHTYGEQVLMPYGCSGVHAAEKAVFRRLSSDIASRLVSDNGAHWYAPGAVWEILYAEDGETNAWFYGAIGTYAFEIEANDSSQGFNPSFSTWRDSTVARSRPAWRYLLDRIDGPGISGHVTDACTGAPLAAQVSLDEVVFTNGEPARTSEPEFGRFHWLTNAGSYHLRAGKPGYSEQFWPLTVTLARVDRPIRLVPDGAGAVAIDRTSVAELSGDFNGEADPGETLRLTVRARNTGAGEVTGLTAALSTTDPYVTIVDGSADYVALPAGVADPGEGFVVAISPGAPDEHEAVLHVAFTADQPLCAAAQDVTLRITTGRAGCVLLVDFGANPGWTIVNSTSGGWAFGPPAGDGGANGPASAFTGSNVYGTNLAGSYANNADYQLLTVPYNLTQLRHGVLRFQRWLDNEPGFDLASVDVSNDGGGTWIPLTSAFGYGEGWTEEVADIAAAADARPNVRFRFRLRSDGFDVRSGFYLDDLMICGESLRRPPNGVGSTLTVAKAGADLTLGWSPATVDASHDPADFYFVRRSLAPGSGFAVATSSGGTTATLFGEAATPAPGYFLVTAQNGGGSSPDVPVP